MRPTLFGKAFQLLVLLTCPVLVIPATAQRTLSYTEPDVLFRNGLEWFEKNNYAAARQEFLQYLDRKKPITNISDQNAVSAEYYIALTGLYLDIPEAEVQVDRFVKNHREHPKAGLLYGDLGKYYFDKGDYDRAITFLEKAIKQSQNANGQAGSKYLLAMAYYSKQDLRSALPLLNQIKQDPGLDQAPSASYYAGVINFRQGNYREAIADFKRLEQNPTYQNEIPNWIVQSMYKAGRYDDLLAYSQPLLQRNRGNAAQLAEVALFTAEVLYKKGDYAKAVPFYKQYSNIKGRSVPPAVQFRYGDALFKTGDYTGAIAALKNVSAGKDTIAQYSAYRLGISYLQTANPSFALNAFDQSARLNFNKTIQEESAFNHAKLQLDLNNGGDAVKEFTDFLKRYPDSKFENESNELLSEAYFSSNNNAAAITYIEGLKRRTPRINASYQRITYNQAVTDFNAERYDQAIANLDKSLKYPVDADLRNSALFWKAESYSALRKYDEAIPLYQQAMRSGNVSPDLQGKSLYALGYASYNKKNYTQAITYFRDFISKSGSSDKQAIEDATVRVADSYFATKNYNEAMRYYDNAIAQGRIDRDYATFQKGVILAFMERDVEAKAQFDKLLAQFPNSRYADDALFQSANVDFEKGAYQASIRGFSRLISEKPKSYLLPAALLKRATANTNLQLYEPAIQDYKRILDQFGGSPSAPGALLGLQNALSDAGRAEEFSSTLATYKKSNPGSTDVQKVEYENAKSLYFNEKYAQAVTTLLEFIDENPGSPLVYEARYYLADSYFRSGDLPNALRYYYSVISDNKSDFVTRAAARAAEVERQQKNYPRAIRNYRTVLAQSKSKNEQSQAVLGLMDTYYATGNYDSTQVAAREVLSMGNVVPGAQNRAQLMLGKVAYAKGDYKLATTEFDKTIALAKDEQGAEANYWIADILYRTKKYKESIDALLRFNSDFAQYDYWKGKGFILVADNNVAQNEVAQAKAVLNSIIENAENQEIVAEAKQKLAAIDNK
ncbi:tetratricopeptide repeat protein [Larkinella knui]|uniref:Outer membrane protein assembly factor BamD n=1 Tax=Larkinella knui TaxID=2025310 RepID=A0A3P1CXG3_9BACT|nr:tetratricopeptide repeat protein [Larkinella knui]RRB17868.1 outer membrane protein assembly factor BamD [Larkinella knui]